MDLRRDCRVCGGAHWRIVPDEDLHNAHVLLDRRGIPDRITFDAEAIEMGWRVGTARMRYPDDDSLCALLRAVGLPLRCFALRRQFMRARNGEWIRIT